MPVNIGIVFLGGAILGWVVVLLLRPPEHLRGLVVASCSAPNLGTLLLVVIPAVCREDGNPFAGGDDGGACANRGLSYASFSLAVLFPSRFS
jgi:predicted permease